MEKKRGRLIEVVGSIAAAAVVVLYLWVAVNQPVPASTQTPSAPNATQPAPTTGQTSPPQSNPSSGGNSPSGAGPPQPETPPSPPPALGNGHKVPKGWANAECPDHAKGKGVTARCTASATYGELRKAGQAGSLIDSPNSEGRSASARAHAPAELRGSEDGNSVASGHNPGHHYGQL